MIKSGTEAVSLEYYYSEITSENVDKWNALAWLAEKIVFLVRKLLLLVIM